VRPIRRIVTTNDEHGRFGVLGGIGPDPVNLMFMKQTGDRLFGGDYLWSVLAAGRSQMPFATQAALLGGSVRVGLEDSLYIGRGKRSRSGPPCAEISWRYLRITLTTTRNIGHSGFWNSGLRPH
jgi:uncharacterized protein (DUF849 family)